MTPCEIERNHMGKQNGGKHHLDGYAWDWKRVEIPDGGSAHHLIRVRMWVL